VGAFFSSTGNEPGESGSSRKAIVALIFANVIPLVGVLFFGWQVGEIVAVYWLENVTVGIVNVIKLLTNRHPKTERSERLSLSAFFTVHYGMFCVGHATFVFGVLGASSLGSFAGGGIFSAAVGALKEHPVAFFGFFASHLFSYFTNYLGKGEAESMPLNKVMFLPYPRIFVLHITIIFGAFAVQAIGSPFILLLVLLAAKTIGDIKFHQKEHKKTYRADR